MKNLTFQGIFELQTDLEEKVLTSHTCLRYSKGPPGSHNSSAHRIMCIRRVERNIFQFGATPPKRAFFWGCTGPMVRAAPRRLGVHLVAEIDTIKNKIKMLVVSLAHPSNG